ncbi:MAG TPA: hypothetical protein DD473_13850 [Planctomycetaceae bacterium]|nr:hypothetical protein [Planctomycetaceae bacterium]
MRISISATPRRYFSDRLNQRESENTEPCKPNFLIEAPAVAGRWTVVGAITLLEVAEDLKSVFRQSKLCLQMEE